MSGYNRQTIHARSSLPCRGCTSKCPRFGSCDQRPWRAAAGQSPDAARLTVFYDGNCPLCVKEMRQLAASDAHAAIALVDIQATDMATLYPAIDTEHAGRILHGLLPDGRMLYGLDVTSEAWSLVGRHRWIKLLRLPLVRPLSDACYLLFARHRYTISKLLTGRARCESCRIDAGPADA